MSAQPSGPSAAVSLLRLLAGVLFAGIGLAFLLESIGVWSWSPVVLADALTWIAPGLLVIAGLVLLATGARRD